MNQHYLMVRRPAWDLVQHMKTLAAKQPGNIAGSSIGIHGPRGVGKSAAVFYCTEYAFSNGWLVIAAAGREFPNDLVGLLEPSKHPDRSAKGIFDQPGFTSNFMGKLIIHQEDLLKQVILKNQNYDYEWTPKPREGEAEEDHVWLEYDEGASKTLFDMARLAQHDITQAPSILYDFVEELKQITEYELLFLIFRFCLLSRFKVPLFSCDCRIPVLIAFDEINMWDNSSPFPDPANPKVDLPSDRLAMVDAFKCFNTQGPSNGVAVFSSTWACSQRTVQKRLAEATFAVDVKRYDNREMKQAVTHYDASGMLARKLDPFLLAHFKGLTGGVGRDVLELGWLV